MRETLRARCSKPFAARHSLFEARSLLSLVAYMCRGKRRSRFATAELFAMLTQKGQQTMTKRFIPPAAKRVSAVAIAAALAAFGGVAAAQSKAPSGPPGFVVDSSGNVVRGAYTE